MSSFDDVIGSQVRDSEVPRKALSGPSELRIWTKSAGRCVLCAAYLLENRTERYHTTKVGQVAHIVGATPTAKSPRNLGDLTRDERAYEQNLLLLCYPCHRMIDDADNVEYWTEARLTLRKEEHEARVLRATDFATLTQAIVITTEGAVRGNMVQVPPRQVMHALIEAGLITHVDGGHRNELTIKLQGDPSKPYYWESGRDQIDTIFGRAVMAAETGKVERLAIFAMTPIPLLVYLGSRIGSKLATTVFDRHRDDAGSDSWAWRNSDHKPSTFEIMEGQEDPQALEVLTVVTVTGSAKRGVLPEGLSALPTIRLQPADGDPRPGLVESVADLKSAKKAWTDLLAKIENRYPAVQRLHVIAAVPASVAIHMGRERMRDAHPELVVYELLDGNYVPTPPITDARRN